MKSVRVKRRAAKGQANFLTPQKDTLVWPRGHCLQTESRDSMHREGRTTLVHPSPLRRSVILLLVEEPTNYSL